MKKLWFLVLLIFVPLIFVGCFEKQKEPRDVAKIVLTNFKSLPNYECTFSYTKDGKEVTEKCVHETLFENEYYYYTYSEDSEVKKEYWVDKKVIVSGYKKIDGVTSYFTSNSVEEALSEASENSRLFIPKKYNLTDEELKAGNLVKNGGVGDYLLTVDDYTFDIKNEVVKKINYNGIDINYEDGRISSAGYRSIYTNDDIKEGKEAFDLVLEKIEKLEKLAEKFITESDSTYSKRYLTLNYIRSGSTYVGSNWNAFLGNINEIFVDYVEENQGSDNLTSLREIKKLDQPYTAHKIDFMHLIAVISLNEKCGTNSSYSDLGGFGGDIAQLSVGLKNIEDDETLQQTANDRMGSEDYAFGLLDYMADIDGINIGRDLLSNMNLTVSDALKNYFYNYDLSFSTIKAISALNIYPTTKEIASAKLLGRLENNNYISFWLFKNGGSFGKHFSACVNAFINFAYMCL